ncbi:MAG: DNA repair protein RecO [Bacteriovoracia bacterium]
MTPNKDLAIVLRSVVFQDRDRIVTALTQNHGRITALAKNSVHSKRFGGSLEAFTAGEWLFTQKPNADMAHLSEANVKRAYEGLRRDFHRLSIGSAFSEIILKLTHPNEPCPQLFQLHSNALAVLEETDNLANPFSLLNMYLAKVLQWSGHQPDFLNCLACEKSLNDVMELTAIVSEGGWVCADCRHTHAPTHAVAAQGKHPLHRHAIVDLLMAMNHPFRQAVTQVSGTPDAHQDLFAYLEAFLSYHVAGFDRAAMKSLRFISGSSEPLPPGL